MYIIPLLQLWRRLILWVVPSSCDFSVVPNSVEYQLPQRGKKSILIFYKKYVIIYI